MEPIQSVKQKEEPPRGILSIDQHKLSFLDLNDFVVDQEESEYKTFVKKKNQFLVINEDLPIELLREPIFQPKLLKIGKKGWWWQSAKPEYKTIVWVTKKPCNNVDIHWLIEYLESKKRDCHINTGAHGKLCKGGRFEFDWMKKGAGDQLRQDVESAIGRKIEISFHMIAKVRPPCYYAGVDIIDAFCYSWYLKLSDEELEKVYEEYITTQEEKIKQRELDLKITPEVENQLQTVCAKYDARKYKDSLENWQALKPLTHATIVSYVRSSGSKLSPEDNTKLETTIEGVLRLEMDIDIEGQIYFGTVNEQNTRVGLKIWAQKDQIWVQCFRDGNSIFLLRFNKSGKILYRRDDKNLFTDVSPRDFLH